MHCLGAPTRGRRLALHDVLLGFLSLSKRTALLSHSHSASVAVVLLTSSRFNWPKLDISSRVAVCSQPCDAENVSCGSTGSVYDAVNRWRRGSLPTTRRQASPTFGAVFVRRCTAAASGATGSCACASAGRSLLQSCHFAVFPNPLARSSTDRFFTFCHEHVAQERDSQAERLQRRHEKVGPGNRSSAVRSDGRSAFLGPTHHLTFCFLPSLLFHQKTGYFVMSPICVGKSAHNAPSLSLLNQV